MAPLENGGFQPSPWDGSKGRSVDVLMRALLYIAQQIGRPVSEVDVRRLTSGPQTGLDEQAFLIAATRLGLRAEALDLSRQDLDRLATPFVLLSAQRPACVVVTGREGRWVVLDVIEGRVGSRSTAEVKALGSRALVM